MKSKCSTVVLKALRCIELNISLKLSWPGTVHRGSAGVLCPAGCSEKYIDPSSQAAFFCPCLTTLVSLSRMHGVEDAVFLGGLFYVWHSTVPHQVDAFIPLPFRGLC